MVSSATILRRIFDCLFLILLSRYCDAAKSEQLELILTNLQRIESLLTQQAQTESLNCLVPINVLNNLITESSPDEEYVEESNETRRQLRSQNSDKTDIQKLLNLDDLQRLSSKVVKRRKQANYNENANVNRNINTNQLRTRRILDDNLQSQSLNRNSNLNINTNLNKYKGNLFDLSDEYTN